MFPARQQIYSFYGIGKSYFSHVLVTSILTFIACFVPCVYPDISGLLGLLGGLTIGVSGYVMPFLLRTISLKEISIFHPKRLSFVFMFLFVSTVAVISMSVSIYDYVAEIVNKVHK